jgi:hypothetical protein
VLEDRYEGHPQLQKLIQLKDKQVGTTAQHLLPALLFHAECGVTCCNVG